MKAFRDFTKLYELNRTLRFRLIPFPQTKTQLELDGVVEKDRNIEKNYHKIKEYLDKLHIKFTTNALENVYLEKLEEYEEKYNLLKNNPKDKKIKTDFEKVEKEIRKEIVSFFEAEGDRWKEKYSFAKKGGIGVLTEKEVLDILSTEFPEQKEIFESFKGFFTYFSNFNESRKNFYKDEGKAGQIATRAINENLHIFLENKGKYEKFLEEHPDFFMNEEKSVFELDFYNSCLSQNGIDTYNQVIGAKALDEGKNTEGINQRINLLKQHDLKSNKKNQKYPKFDLLYKQILSQKSEKDFIPTIENNEELFEIISNNITINTEKISQIKILLEKLFDEDETFNLEEIYLSKTAVNTLSNKYFESWNTLAGYLGENAKKSYISLSEIKNILENISEKNIFKDEYYKGNIAFDNTNNYKNFLAIFRYEFLTNIGKISGLEDEIKQINTENFTKSTEQIESIKKYFDAIMDIYAMSKYFYTENKLKKGEEYPKDITFYTDFDAYFTDFEIWKTYNLIRNYLIKKEVQTDKFKLNFDNSQFLTGWDKDKEKERFGTILRKDGKYFLAILKKGNNKIFENYIYASEEDFYEKMEYKQLNNVYRQIPRLAFPLQKKLDNLEGQELEKYLEKYRDFGYNDEIAQIKEEFDIFQKNKEKGEKFPAQKMKKMIAYYKSVVLEKYDGLYDLSKVKNSEYSELVEFYDDVEKSMYSLNFVRIGADFLENLEKNGEIYLFQIYNKDFSEYKKSDSTENIHTKYFKHLFSEENLKDLQIKLSGGAEIFFRDKTKNLKQAKNKNGEELFYEKNGEKKKVLEHRRYAKDTYLFHISTTLNANSGDMYQFNAYFNEYFQPKHIIGIDRGEKHLAYFSVVDLEGNLKDTGSLNIVNDINYLEKLEEKETSRMQGRKSWGEIENIKNLKDGYISAVVNKLAKLVIEYQAIIVFEDLNSGFKRGRQKVERQIYQKLELALAKKLNYLTFKTQADSEIGGSLNGIQIVPKVNDYQDIANYKQSGIIFYINPAYTSTTCPNCGWRKTLKFPTKTTKSSIIDFFKDIEIRFDGEKFAFTYKNGIGNAETLYSNVLRTQWNNKARRTDHIDNISDKLENIFKKYNIDFDSEIGKQFFNEEVLGEDLKSVFYYFKLLQNIRNSDSKKDEDIISCSCCGYNSGNGWQGKDFNGDANGAYNTARKGIIMLEKIKNEEKSLLVRNEDWDEFLGRK